MPIYEYQCEQCGHRLEAIQKISDKPLSDCPACAKPALKKLVSAASFRLKGSGWYETDFKSGDKKQLADADNAQPGDSSGDNNDKQAASKNDGNKEESNKKESSKNGSKETAGVDKSEKKTATGAASTTGNK